MELARAAQPQRHDVARRIGADPASVEKSPRCRSARGGKEDRHLVWRPVAGSQLRIESRIQDSLLFGRFKIAHKAIFILDLVELERWQIFRLAGIDLDRNQRELVLFPSFDKSVAKFFRRLDPQRALVAGAFGDGDGVGACPWNPKCRSRRQDCRGCHGQVGFRRQRLGASCFVVTIKMDDGGLMIG